MSACYALVNEGLQLYAKGDYFEAHERFETTWRAADGAVRSTLQALIQLCAASIKGTQGNLHGLRKLLTKIDARLDDGPPSALGLDLVALHDGVKRSVAALSRSGEYVPVELPSHTTDHGVLYLHGFASGPSSTKARVIAPALRAEGLEVRIPDLNEGGFEHLTVSRMLASAARRLLDRTLVIGSSLGGYTASLLACQDPRVRALVLMAPAFDFASRLEDQFGAEAIQAWRVSGFTEVEHHAHGAPRRLGYSLYADAQLHAARPRPTVPTYILHGARDEVVPPAVVRAVAAALPRAELEVVDDEHELTRSSARALRAARRLTHHLAGGGSVGG